MCNFPPDNRPYWFDLPEVIGQIWQDILDAVQAVQDTATWLKDTFSGKNDDKAKDYTGVTMVS